MTDPIDLSAALAPLAHGVLALASQQYVDAAKAFTEAALALAPVDILRTWLDDASAKQADEIADAAERAKVGG